MRTYDSATIESAGAFLVGELERLDPTLNAPLVAVTWNRDIHLREDVTIGDEASAFTNTDFGAVGTEGATGKNWVGPQADAIAGISVSTNKTTNPMHLWAMAAAWSIPELVRAQQLGRPIDSQKHDGLTLKHNMDVDEQVYIGDEIKGCCGLVNNPDITPVGFATEWDEATTPQTILDDINAFISHVWEQTGFAVCPDNLRLPPLKFGLLTQPVSAAGSESILQYVARQCLSATNNGRPLDIKPLKWLNKRGAANKDRALAYTKNKTYVRFPMVPLQRTPLEYRGIHEITTYFGTLGEVEFVYPETVGYADGL